MGKKIEVQSSTVVTDSQGRQVNPDLITPAGATPLAVKSGQMTLDTYFAIRGVPVQNRAGMRAFTKEKSADLKAWDTVFRRY